MLDWKFWKDLGDIYYIDCNGGESNERIVYGGWLIRFVGRRVRGGVSGSVGGRIIIGGSSRVSGSVVSGFRRSGDFSIGSSVNNGLEEGRLSVGCSSNLSSSLVGWSFNVGFGSCILF